MKIKKETRYKNVTIKIKCEICKKEIEVKGEQSFLDYI